MINEVYESCLALLNKNNYGYMTPQEFNLFAQQAQIDIFEDNFFEYNAQINEENLRQSGTGYADIAKGIEEVMAIFSLNTALTRADDPYPLPTAIPSNEFSLPANYYFINKLYYYSTQLGISTTTAVTGWGFNVLSADFATPPQVGDVCVNISSTQVPWGSSPTPTSAYITSITTVGPTHTIITSENIWALGGVTLPDVAIYTASSLTEIEKVNQNKIFNLTMSNLTTPTADYPAYVLGGNIARVHPYTIDSNTFIFTQYIRYPHVPNWTFTMVGTAAQFNISALDYQNFELPEDSFNDLVSRILQYGGMTIRDIPITQFGQYKEALADHQPPKTK